MNFRSSVELAKGWIKCSNEIFPFKVKNVLCSQAEIKFHEGYSLTRSVNNKLVRIWLEFVFPVIVAMRTPAIGPIPSRAKFGGAALARKPVSNACYFGRTHTHVVPLSSCELKPCFAVLVMSHAFVYFSASYIMLPLITKGYKPLHIQIVRIHCLCKPQT